MVSECRTLVRSGKRLCLACEPQGFCTFGVSVLTFDDAAGAMHSRFSCPSSYEGGPGVAHGGWVCAVMDELLGQYAIDTHGHVVTATLSVDFKRPVAVGEPLIGTAWLEPTEGRKQWAHGELRLEASNALLATARGLFIMTPPDHHDRHAQWLEAQKAINEAAP